ncbi:MAG: tyrosine-type recombinase/integrase [Chitinophagaceae bacterium]|nr:tyrosine-type recombinase/integrase [Chitinophagaceae bacterium]
MRLEKYLQQRYSAATARAYHRDIEIYLANYAGAADAKYGEVMDYIGRLRQRYSNPSTLKRVLASIKVYYDYLCAIEAREDHPARSIRLKDQRTRDIQLQDLFTTQELDLLLDRQERYRNLDYRNRVLMSLLIYQGLHPQEIAALEVTDFNLHAAQVFIRATPKTNSRTLALKAGQILSLQEYMHQIRPQLLNDHTVDQLIIGLRGTPMCAEDITKHVKRSYAGIYAPRKINAQTIRQSVIANLLKSGNDISAVQIFAGHKYPGSTQKYRQNEVKTLQAAVNKYHPFG